MSNPLFPLVKTRADLELLGTGRTQITRLQRRGELLRICRGAYIRADDARDLSTEDRARVTHIALARTHPKAVISHSSAALLWGAPLLTLPAKAHLSIATINNRGHPAITYHCQRPEVHTDSTFVQGVPVTSTLVTTLDCIRTLPLLDSLAITNHFLHTEAYLPHQLVEALVGFKGRGVRTARLIPAVMSPHCESPLESLACLRFYEWGIEPPVQQMRVRAASGRRYRPDFTWPHLRLILEVDGDFKYYGRFAPVAEQLRKDVFRQRELAREGWTVVRATWQELMHAPEVVRADLLKNGVRVREAPTSLPHPGPTPHG